MILWFIDNCNRVMTLQFRQKSQKCQLEELEKEVGLLRDYNKALEQENGTRNAEQRALK